MTAIDTQFEAIVTNRRATVRRSDAIGHALDAAYEQIRMGEQALRDGLVEKAESHKDLARAWARRAHRLTEATL